MNRTSLVSLLVAIGLFASVGCATKKYVQNQITPINNKIGELDDITAKNTQGIEDANAADQKAGSAATSADQANQGVTRVGNGLNGLQGTVENLDNYKPVANTTVQFGFNKYMLSKSDEQTLDEFAQQIGQQKHYIVQVQGYTDNVGDASYNAQLSRRRADAVIRYLASKYNVPPFRIYIIGMGEDNPVAENNHSAGRAKNRRVDVQLLTNSLESASAQAKPPASQNTGDRQ